MADWRYREALKRSTSFLLKNYEPTTLSELIAHIYSKGHIDDSEYRYICEMRHSKEQLSKLLLHLTSEDDERNVRHAFNELTRKLDEDAGRADIPEVLRKHLVDVMKLPKPPASEEVDPFKMVTGLHDRIRDNVMFVSPIEILTVLRSIKDTLDPDSFSRRREVGKVHSTGSSKNSLPALSDEDNDLMKACVMEDEVSVASLIQNTEDRGFINATNNNRQTALTVSVIMNSFNIVTTLLDCPCVDVNVCDSSGRTALMYGVMSGCADVVLKLLSRDDLNVRVADAKGLTAVWYVYGEETVDSLTYQVTVRNVYGDLENTLQQRLTRIKDLHEGLDWGRIEEVVKILLASEKIDDIELLKSALLIGSEPIVKRILQHLRVSPNGENVFQFIMHAIAGANPKMLATLIENGNISVGLLNNFQVRSVVKLAIRLNHRKICKSMLKLITNTSVSEELSVVLTIQAISIDVLPTVLKDYKASNFNMEDEMGNTVFMILCKYCNKEVVAALLAINGVNIRARNSKDETAFMLACSNMYVDVPKLLIDNKVFDVKDCDNIGCTNLMHACRGKNLPAVVFLVESVGADVNVLSKLGETAFMWACRGGDTGVVKFLLALGTIDVNARNIYGNTAFILACEEESDEMVMVLHETPGVDVNSENNERDTALMRACRCNNIDTTALLLRLHMSSTESVENLNTAFMVAVSNASMDLVRLFLVMADADVNTVFLYACRYENLTVVKCLLNEADIDGSFTDVAGRTAVMWACSSGNVELVKFLIRRDDMDAKSATKSGVNALMMACTEGTEEIVKLLLDECDIDVNAKDSSGDSAMARCLSVSRKRHLLINSPNYNVNMKFTKNGRTALFIACSSGDVELVSLVLQKPHVNVNVATASGLTPLMIACTSQKADSEIVRLLLNSPGIDVNAKDNNDETALMKACHLGDILKTALLLRVKDIDINACGSSKDQTALMMASAMKSTDIVTALLNMTGIDVNASNSEGETALMKACNNEDLLKIKLLLSVQNLDLNVRSANGETALMMACVKNSADIVTALLNIAGVDVSASNSEGRTALSLACSNGKTQFAAMLIDNGQADVKARDSKGRAAFFHACENGHDEVAKLLLSRGNVHVNEKDDVGNTALFRACENDHAKIVALLVACDKIDLSATNANGETVLHIAKRLRNSCLDLLKNDRCYLM